MWILVVVAGISLIRHCCPNDFLFFCVCVCIFGTDAGVPSEHSDAREHNSRYLRPNACSAVRTFTCRREFVGAIEVSAVSECVLVGASHFYLATCKCIS